MGDLVYVLEQLILPGTFVLKGHCTELKFTCSSHVGRFVCLHLELNEAEENMSHSHIIFSGIIWEISHIPLQKLNDRPVIVFKYAYFSIAKQFVAVITLFECY